MTRISSSTSSVAMQAYAAKRMTEQKEQAKPMKSVQHPRPIASLDTAKVSQETPVNLYSPAGKATNRL
jgi:hypothetical protein